MVQTVDEMMQTVINLK
ncbi:MAG: hypothetical protein IPK53_05290 [bacterium]|nr:hypothetical protein [bacterium]